MSKVRQCNPPPNARSHIRIEKSASRGRLQRHARCFGVFRSEKLVTWILLGQLAQQLLREGVLFFTACGKGKHNFGERLEVKAVLCSLGELLHTEFLVPVNSTKPECETGTSALRSNNVIGDARRDVRVGRVRMLS